MKIGSLFGIAITVNLSWIFVFALVVWSLANPVGPLRLQGVAPLERVALGGVAALLFFASVLVHELAHSLLARRRGIPVRGITLFIFGGVSQFEGEARDAPGEAWISGAGPLTSLLIGVLFYGASVVFGGSATHLGTMLQYLSGANVLLALFNIVPAYPLDGGRVLHALVWRVTGDRKRATRLTVVVGRVLAALMIAAGIFLSLVVDPFAGLWLTFIGWFLLQAGNAEQSGVALRDALQGHVAADLAAPATLRISADTTAAAARDAMRGSSVVAVPVVVGDRVIGVVSLHDLAGMSAEELRGTYVTAAMRRVEDLPSLPADAPASDALSRLAQGGDDAILLTDPAGEGTRLFTRESAMLWLGGSVK